jgi:tetratricopeptide (TPR) repeat protein
MKQAVLKLSAIAMMVTAAPMVLTALNVNIDGTRVEAAEAQKKTRKRRVPTMRARIFSQLDRAKKFADEKKLDEAMEILKKFYISIDQLNSMERAQVYSFTGYIRYDNNEVDKAIEAFKKVIEQQPIRVSLELNTLRTLASLTAQEQDYDAALNYMKRWADLNKKGPNASSEAFLGRVNFYKKDLNAAIKHLQASLDLDAAEGKKPSEKVLELKRVVHFQLKQPLEVTKISEQLVRHYGKPNHWVELANMYGEIGEEKKQFAVMEAAHQQGFVTKASDLRTLAQLYYTNGAPYKAALVLEKGINNKVLKPDLKNLRFLAQNWSEAKEFDKAIPVYQAAAELAEDGQMYAELAQVFANKERWKDVISAGEKAFARDGVKYPANLRINLGIAHYNLKHYKDSSSQFEQAKDDKTVGKIAKSWIKYVDKEYKKQLQIARDLGERVSQL